MREVQTVHCHKVLVWSIDGHRFECLAEQGRGSQKGTN